MPILFSSTICTFILKLIDHKKISKISFIINNEFSRAEEHSQWLLCTMPCS